MGEIVVAGILFGIAVISFALGYFFRMYEEVRNSAKH